MPFVCLNPRPVRIVCVYASSADFDIDSPGPPVAAASSGAAPGIQTKAEGSNVFGRENSIYPVLQTYEEGSIIELKVAVSTYHWVRHITRCILSP